MPNLKNQFVFLAHSPTKNPFVFRPSDSEAAEEKSCVLFWGEKALRHVILNLTKRLKIKEVDLTSKDKMA